MDKDKPIKPEDILNDIEKTKEPKLTEEESEENYTKEQSDKFFKDDKDDEMLEIDFE